MENIVFWSYLFVVFLFLGSFLNVLALRTLEGTSVWNPRYSHCPSCATRLTGRDLVPILSWLVLRGRCRTCQHPISWLYPLGEMATAVLLTFVVVHGGWNPETGAVVVLFTILITVTLTDLRAQLIPNRITFPAMALLLLVRLFLHPEPVWVYLLGFLVGGGLLTLLAMVPNGMGGGDVKLFAVIGLGVGWKLVLFALFFSCVWGTVIGLPLKWTGRLQARQAIPFAPFILLGTLTAWAFGQPVWNVYRTLFL
ncbi:prepilin peptidase [Tumebacillus permanentifrigoris]|uniref:Leader peptidase (Prepilin peptidase)/N-methyltransferase n=1 Tax=Tumebacillus permanentifrigoris TaxID=378543 RepID=A0A316D3Z1_9BACL|nr:A24 family peptidase [Tumebacillus permanentifrigoris]PWK06251.1 leader peptidase (prepilin peptidase)/N-methyltransferase [Tumebacillus permanentifrigoris]